MDSPVVRSHNFSRIHFDHIHVRYTQTLGCNHYEFIDVQASLLNKHNKIIQEMQSYFILQVEPVLLQECSLKRIVQLFLL